MTISDVMGGPDHTTPLARRFYGAAIAHEFGHVLNLGHRVERVPATQFNLQRDATSADPPERLYAGGAVWDGLLIPPRENIMHWLAQATAQDFDIIQARAVRLSPLLANSANVPPAGPPSGPPAPPIAPPEITSGSEEYAIREGDWLEKIAARYGMTWQELYAYDGGTGVPNRDRLRSGDPNRIYPGEIILVPASP